jgi:hypothetical protein
LSQLYDQGGVGRLCAGDLLEDPCGQTASQFRSNCLKIERHCRALAAENTQLAQAIGTERHHYQETSHAALINLVKAIDQMPLHGSMLVAMARHITNAAANCGMGRNRNIDLIIALEKELQTAEEVFVDSKSQADIDRLAKRGSVPYSDTTFFPVNIARQIKFIDHPPKKPLFIPRKQIEKKAVRPARVLLSIPSIRKNMFELFTALANLEKDPIKTDIDLEKFFLSQRRDSYNPAQRVDRIIEGRIVVENGPRQGRLTQSALLLPPLAGVSYETAYKHYPVRLPDLAPREKYTHPDPIGHAP